MKPSCLDPCLPPAHSPRTRRTAASVCGITLAAIFSLSCPPIPLTAQESNSPKYGADVVAKAEKILSDAGLRRSGKQIQSTGLPEISRALTGLKREKRELGLVHQEWKKSVDKLTEIRNALDALNARNAELNSQLARVAGVDVAANNRIVGLINVCNAQMKTLVSDRAKMKDEITKRRQALSGEESQYAEIVLAIRRDFDAALKRLDEALDKSDVRIALQVMHTNYGTPEKPTADEILSMLDKRIGKAEDEVFNGSVPMEFVNNSAYVDVVVGRKTVRMVIDSGATMICLPTHVATELEVKVPVDARELQLNLADGSSIVARGVILPRVRVGEFEAENVEAVVYDAPSKNAEPLLGMSYLGRFKFEVDQAQQRLTLLRVSPE